MLKVILVSILMLYANSVETKSKEVLRNETESAELQNVLYFGWFLSKPTAATLEDYTDNHIFRKLYSAVPSVGEFLKDVGASDPFNYFVKPVDPNSLNYDPFYHVTAKYCGGGIDCTEYYKTAKDSLGNHFMTHLIGFYFTARTYGIRVNLTADQEPLFEKEESRTQIRKKRAADPDYPVIAFVDQPLNFQPSTSKAHVTLGCAPNIPAVQTGYDLLDIIGYETSGAHSESYDLGTLGILRQFHKEDIQKTAFVLYPKKKLVVMPVFKTYTSSSSILKITNGMKLFLAVITMLYESIF